MPLSRDDFVLDVGGFLDSVKGRITNAEFEYASGKYADQVLMDSSAKLPIVITLTVDSESSDQPIPQSFSIGGSDQWEIAEDGKSVSNVNNPDKKSFRAGSIAGHLVEAMMTSAGNGDIEKGQDFFIDRGHHMTDAAFYEGLTFYWETKELHYDIGGRKFSSRPPLPASFIGEDKDTNKGKGKSKKEDTSSSDADLDKILIDNATGKTDKQLKSFAVKDPKIKANDAYTKSVISGAKIKELEQSGDLIKDPDSDVYL